MLSLVKFRSVVWETDRWMDDPYGEVVKQVWLNSASDLGDSVTDRWMDDGKMCSQHI